MKHFPRPLRRACHTALAITWVLLLSAQSHALDIVITNDDGFEASTIHALYHKLIARGHRVIISSETQDNSGKGGAADFFRPMGLLAKDSRAGFVKAGAPAVGTLPEDANVMYVDGTPLAAALYGLDIAAPQRWGKAPDLVVSGPNYGNNTGLVNNSSGTVNAALICINRGVPAIAVSTAMPAGYKPFDKLSPGDPEYEVADVVLRVVEALERARAGNRLLPAGVGLNINVPKFKPGTLESVPVKLSREGYATAAVPIFTMDLSHDAAAQKLGLPSLPAAPGVSVRLPPSSALITISDTDAKSEQHMLDAGNVTVSAIQGNHQASNRAAGNVRRLLKSLFLREDIIRR